jgi:hypothetical protein
LKLLPQISQTSELAGMFSSGSSATGGACGKVDLQGKKGVLFIKLYLQKTSLFALLIKLCGHSTAATRKTGRERAWRRR